MVLANPNRSLDYKTIVNTMRQLFARPSSDPTPVKLAEELSVSVYTNRNGKGQGRGKGKSGGNTCHACGKAGHWARDFPVNPPHKTDPKTESNPVTCYKCRKPGHKSNECKEEALHTEGKETCLYADLLRLAEEEGIVSPNVPK